MARKKAAKQSPQAAEPPPAEQPAATPPAADLPAPPPEPTIVDRDSPAVVGGPKPWAAEPSGGRARRPGPRPPEDRPGEADPFPPVIRTAVLGDGYKVRLQQSRDKNEVQIKFGEGRPADKPSDAIIALIKAQEGPGGTRFRWNDGDRAWGMPIRDPIHDPNLLSTREKARQVFNQVVKMAAQERGTGVPR